MLFLQLWLIGSIGFVLGWVVRSALAKVRAESHGRSPHDRSQDAAATGQLISGSSSGLRS